MKKIFKTLGLVCLTTVLLTFTSCKKQEKLILGTWNLTTIAAGPVSIDVSALSDSKVTFNSDNTIGMNITPNETYISPLIDIIYHCQPGTPEYAEAFANILELVNDINAIKGTYALGDNKLTLTVDNQPISLDIQTLDKKSLIVNTDLEKLLPKNTPTAKDGTATTKMTLTFSK